jgi:two-component system, OmpR family, sensor histidine kinase TctE
MTETGSLRRRLLLWLMLPVLTVSAVNALISYSQALRVANLVYDHWLTDSAIGLSQQVHLDDARINVDLPSAAIRLLEFDQIDHIYYAVTSAEQDLIAGYRGLPQPPRVEGSFLGPQVYDGEFEHKPIRLAAVRMAKLAGTHDISVLVIVAETLGKRQMLAREILWDVILPQLILIIVAGVAVWLGVGRGLVPLATLRQQISSRTPRDLGPLTLAESPQEVRPLVQALNDLLSRLRAAIDAQQRFVTDAAHQLRTPLAGLKTQAELALRESEMPAIRHSLEQIKTASEQTARLANQLLSLARAEPSSYQPQGLADLDLGTMAREVTSDWIQTALDNGIDLGFEEAVTAAKVRGNAILLRELISNLIDNAVRYTQRGGQVTVTVIGQDGTVTLSVADNGPGIPESERTRVFERFYRVLGSGREGAGLGLAIVREIADRHGAKVQLSAGPDARGTRLTVVFASN